MVLIKRLSKVKVERLIIMSVPTPEFMAIKDQVMYNAELFSPLAWPMLIEPNDWTPEKPGGYLLNEIMRGHEHGS